MAWVYAFQDVFLFLFFHCCHYKYMALRVRSDASQKGRSRAEWQHGQRLAVHLAGSGASGRGTSPSDGSGRGDGNGKGSARSRHPCWCCTCDQPGAGAWSLGTKR